MLGFFSILLGFVKFCGILIIPKWLIKVPGHVAIPLGWFLELPNFSLFTGPDSPYLSWKYFRKYKNKCGIISETYYLFISQLSGIPIVWHFWTYQTHIFLYYISGILLNKSWRLIGVWMFSHAIILDNPLFWQNFGSYRNHQKSITIWTRTLN